MRSVFNESDLEDVRQERIPDVVRTDGRSFHSHPRRTFSSVADRTFFVQVLVRKGYRVGKRASKRRWKLKHLDMEAEEVNGQKKGEADTKA